MDKGENGSSSFHFDKNGSKKGSHVETKMMMRRRHFMGEQDPEDLKRKRDDKHVSLRKEFKKNKFAKRRNMTFGNDKPKEETKSDKEAKFTVEQAESMWQEGMDIMEYFKILNKTEFELPHFILLVEMVTSREPRKILFGMVGIRKLLSLIDNPPIQSVIDANLLPLILSMSCGGDFPRLQFESLWCLTNIASGKAEHVQALIDKGAIPIFISLLNSDQENIVEQAIWALGNIAGEDSYYKSLILNEGAIKPLAHILSNAAPNSMMARNCSWCITNLLRGKPLPTLEDLFILIPIIGQVLEKNTRKEILTDAAWGVSYISDAGEKAIIKIIE